MLIHAQEDDIGYNLLFRSHPEEFSNHCVKLDKESKPFPSWATGDFVIPSIGLTAMGNRQFVGVLDPFGKLQRFRMNGNTVCATYRIMGTGFYNMSLKSDTVGPGMLFYETDPPRKCPLFHPLCNLPPEAANDNNFVNTLKVGSKMFAVTDSPKLLEIHPETLQVQEMHKFEDDLEEGLSFSASAHPLKAPFSQDWIDFVTNANMLTGKAKVALFRLRQDDPRRREKMAEIDYETSPYMHSFGVTSRRIVLPRMPVKFDLMDILRKPLSGVFADVDPAHDSKANGFEIVPLDGGPAMWRQLPAEEKLYYVHTVNAYENATDVTIDLTTCTANPFVANDDMTFNKSRRDEHALDVVKRFVIPLREDRPVSVSVLSDPLSSTDFPKVNPGYQGKKHCFYWAVQWFHDQKSYASMAITKQDLCYGGPQLSWSRNFWYVSEPTMIPSPVPSAPEDAGVLVFTALDGNSEDTFLLTLDAQSMELQSSAGPFPGIGFTTHGQFYAARATPQEMIV